MTVTVSQLLGDLNEYKFNPVGIHRKQLAVLRAVLNNQIEIVDATNPFIFSMETSAVNTALFMQEQEAATRRLYPKAALTDEELYLHMSDKDFVNRFAVPATAQFTLLFSKEELLSKLVLDSSSGVRKVVIPRNTVFTIGGVTFSLQYPIEIRQLLHGGLQIVYIADKISPLQTLTTNSIDFTFMTDVDGVEYLSFSVLATQFFITTLYPVVNATTGFKTDISLTDSFYYVRVYRQLVDKSWEEILTTHTHQVYDPKTPTALIRLYDGKVRVTIPVIYTTTGMINGKLRIDVYETKGAIDMALSNYQLTDFGARWTAIDVADNTTYTAPLETLKTFFVYSTAHVKGGRDQLSFDELRRRVIDNSTGAGTVPITNVQLSTALKDAGYDVVRNVDTITNRVFLATRDMPKSADERILTAAASSMGTMRTTFEDAVKARGVIDNGQSITLTPKTIYSNVRGILKPLSEVERANIDMLTPSNRASHITENQYYYSPFHYVLDASNDAFEVRAYYLDGPSIESKSFVMENATTGYQASIGADYILTKSEAGYKLTFALNSSDEFKALPDSAVQVQIAFKPKNETTYAYQLATLLGVDETTDERVYEVDIQSSLDVDSDDYLMLQSTEMSSHTVANRCKLLQDIEVFITVSQDISGLWVPNDIDDLIGKFQLPGTAVGLTHERMRLRFGYPLKTLWVQSRSALSSVPYKTYAADVPAVYESNVYQRDPVTGATFSIVNGQLVYNILHHKGDPVLTPAGSQTYKHRKGEPILDSTGAPIPESGYERTMVRHVDILMIEAAYFYANDEVSKSYRATVTETLVTWLTQELVEFNKLLLEQTRIYFYPKVNQGDVAAMVYDGTEVKMSASQAFKVRLHVPSTTYENYALMAALKKATISSLDASLKNQTVSISAAEYALRNVYGDDVIDVEITGLGGDANYPTVTLLDGAHRLSLRKRLTVLADGRIAVEEDVDVDFIEHKLNT